MMGTLWVQLGILEVFTRYANKQGTLWVQLAILEFFTRYANRGHFGYN